MNFLWEVSHLNKLEPALQFEGLLPWSSYFNPDMENLAADAAQNPCDYVELPKDEEDIHNIIDMRLAQESHKVSLTMPKIAASTKVISSSKAWTKQKR